MAKVIDLYRGLEGPQGEPQERLVEFSRHAIIEVITGIDPMDIYRVESERGFPIDPEWTVAPPRVIVEHFLPVPKGTYVLQRRFERQGLIYIVVEPGNPQLKQYHLRDDGTTICMGSHYLASTV